MALKNIIADALGAYLSQIIQTRGLAALSGTEEGRFPKWLTPIIVPKGAIPPEMQERDFIFDSPLKLTSLGFGIGFAGFLWYAGREMDRAALSGADQMEFDLSQKGVEPRIEISYIGLGKGDTKWGIDLVNIPEELRDETGGRNRWHNESDSAAWAHQKAEQMATYVWDKTGQWPKVIWMHHYDEAGHIIDNEGNIVDLSDLGKEMSEFWQPQQQELFKAKRTLTLEMEDIAKSEDPIFACMERRGYTQKQMDRFTDSIAAKATIDIFDKEPEKLTSSETKFQDDIQSCIDTVIKVFGSLEAAGYEDCDCD